MTPEVQSLVDVGILMAQELQELVDDAIEAAGGDTTALAATQELIKDWERAYAAADIKPSWMAQLASMTSPNDPKIDLGDYDG